MPKEKHHLALLSILVLMAVNLGYTFIALFSDVFLSLRFGINRETVPPYFLVLLAAYLAFLALIGFVYLRREWARRVVLLLAVIVLLWSVNQALGLIVNEQILPKIFGNPGLIDYSIHRVTIYFISGLAVIFLALAYPRFSPGVNSPTGP